MKFDFYNQYKDYSNSDLLKIIKRPNDYQTEAVDAATQIVKDRQVSEMEISEVEKYYTDIDKTGQFKKEKISSYKEKATDFFEPILQPGTEVKPGKWINILLLVIGLQYLWSFYNTVTYFIAFLQCNNCHFDFSVFFQFISLVYVPVVFFLLVKQKRWGWILLFADNLFGLVSRISRSYIFFKYHEFYHGDTSSFLIQILLKALFVFFLWKPSVSDFFGVTKSNKERTAVITLITVVFIFGIQFFM